MTRTRRRPHLVLAVVLLLADIGLIGSQSASDEKQLFEKQIRQLFPAPSTFSPRRGDPPRYTVFANDSAPPVPIGFAFWTTDLDPTERGFDGPIKILVGMDMKGVLTGIVVTANHEPYGYFSIDTPKFAAQFKGKSVRDAFAVGADVDAISGASISVRSSARAIRNSARRIATELLTPPPAAR